MRLVYQTEDGRIFDTERKAIRWENSKSFSLNKMKRLITDLSKQQYDDKRLLTHYGHRINNIPDNSKYVVFKLQSDIASRSKRLTHLNREYFQLKNKG